MAIQCTGFFEAGDAIRNVVHDLHLPLKLIVGVRSAAAVGAGTSTDNCPHFAVKLVEAWELKWTRFDPATGDPVALRELHDSPTAAAVLWAE